nr:SAM-dependent methyltransferase [Skermania sp. ID1734]
MGATALFVAAARGLAARQPDPLAVDPFAEVFCRAAGEQWSALFEPGADTSDHPLVSTAFGRNFQEFQAARTRFFDTYLTRAVGAGVRQVVILAAGLDSRAYRLPFPAGTVVYELDRAPVLEFKREVLAEHGAELTAQRCEVAVDLRDDWAKALQQNGFDAANPTAWLIEGLLLYLPADAQDRIFETVDALSASGSQVAIEQMDTIPADVYSQMTKPSAEAPGRNQWATLLYNEPKSEASEWFSQHHWAANRTELADYLAELGVAVDPDAGQIRPTAASFVDAIKR